MTALERSILEALRDLDGAVASRRGPGPRPELGPLLRRVQDLARQLPPETDRDLLHYLHRQSYEKARAWLEAGGGKPERGTCGR